MTQALITAQLTVAEVLAGWPQTARVFMRRRMGCVGCAMAPFQTLADASSQYGLPLEPFLDELNQASRAPGQAPDPASHTKH